MPLSEQEQRLLDEMERHLMQNDADVVSASNAGRALSYRNLVIGAIIALAGLGGVIAGVALWQSNTVWGVILGVVGFVAMLVGVVLAISPSGAPSVAAPGSARRRPSNGGGGSFMDRLNERWDRRQQGG
ncbi:DUF3040 domain-containing protein [Microbacterium sp. Marseille-Q6965]|uniref:DUF3040 domain-containing protein n=1 Tax=Microbacterium sp. Marseille-Q6965 TaxID=2965072 RepID=UPI0021B7BFEA|nr:DUF3040 domain-containing protein [Microbacterium sp. Marseille-Q6965]